MPVSTFLGLETTLRGILAQQLALDVTGHNIANANTVGYSRQPRVHGADRRLHGPRRDPPAAGRPARHRRRRPELPADARRVPRHPVPRADHAAGLGRGRPRTACARSRSPFNEPSDTGLNSLLPELLGVVARRRRTRPRTWPRARRSPRTRRASPTASRASRRSCRRCSRRSARTSPTRSRR